MKAAYLCSLKEAGLVEGTAAHPLQSAAKHRSYRRVAMLRSEKPSAAVPSFVAEGVDGGGGARCNARWLIAEVAVRVAVHDVEQEHVVQQQEVTFHAPHMRSRAWRVPTY